MNNCIKLIIAGLVLITFQSQAQSVLDQSQMNYNAGMSARNLPGYSHWQTFTAGITGNMTKLELGFFTSINATGTLRIYSGAGVSGTPLQSLTVNVVCGGGNCLIPFVTSVPVVSGQQYTFHFLPGAAMPDPYGVQVENPGTYAGGEMMLVDPGGTYQTGFDMVFQTYVESTTGIALIDGNSNAFSFYPNPVKSEMHFAIANNSNITEIKIIAVNGSTIQTFPITDLNTSLNLANLSPGIYCLEIKTPTTTTRQKFVKN